MCDVDEQLGKIEIDWEQVNDIRYSDLEEAYLWGDIVAELCDYARENDINLMDDTSYNPDASIGRLLRIATRLGLTYEFSFKEKDNEI